MRLLLIAFAGTVVSLFLLKKQIRVYFKRFFREPPDSHREWQVKKLVLTMFREKEKYLLPEFVQEVIDFESKTQKKLSDIHEMVEEGYVRLRDLESDTYQESTLGFDPFDIVSYERDNIVQTKVLLASFMLDFQEHKTKIEVSKWKIGLIFESISNIKPEIKAGSHFRRKVYNAVESDIAWVEAREGRKLGVRDRLGFCYTEECVRAIGIPNLKDKFMPRIKQVVV